MPSKRPVSCLKAMHFACKTWLQEVLAGAAAALQTPEARTPPKVAVPLRSPKKARSGAERSLRRSGEAAPCRAAHLRPGAAGRECSGPQSPSWRQGRGSGDGPGGPGLRPAGARVLDPAARRGEAFPRLPRYQLSPGAYSLPGMRPRGGYSICGQVASP